MDLLRFGGIFALKPGSNKEIALYIENGKLRSLRSYTGVGMCTADAIELVAMP